MLPSKPGPHAYCGSMPPVMQFNSFLSPQAAALVSSCLENRKSISITRVPPAEPSSKKQPPQLPAVDINALREAVLRKERELAQLSSVVDWVRQAVQERQEWLVASGTIKEVDLPQLMLADPEPMQTGGWVPTPSARARVEMRTHQRVQAALEAAELAAASVRATLTGGLQAVGAGEPPAPQLTHEESDENFALEYGLLSPIGEVPAEGEYDGAAAAAGQALPAPAMEAEEAAGADMYGGG